MIVPIEIRQPEFKRYDITIDTLPKLHYDRKVAIVTNTTVAPLHLARVMERLEAPQIEVIELPDGEEFKTMETVLSILDRLFEARYDRSSLLIALGGGVIGDMTGFASSLYQRGIGFVQMPTTLLSQVDASVGGKTGVNNRWGKNLVGAFYQPEAVYIDPAFLETLPEREYAAGIAEVVKMAVMFDRDFFDFLEKSDLKAPETAVEMIARSVSLKADVVNRDEKEAGVRAVLNYGHTFGHVIENETGYARYLHGEAVAIGMVMANELAVDLGQLSREEAERIRVLLEKWGLPTRYRVENPEAFYEHFFLDKKSRNNRIKFILPGGSIGSYVMRDDIPKAQVLKALERFRES
ncbi:3-dehydroquinate synthase [Nitratifractor salsuginis]|uniref:3-dehydroquinate synthase n=1 Tax=Nitratifractor salsuginis (strain DSM 16511 / JCM 12458 / E9I37-1) TaxID=749222 RepID=E6WYV5_NITSE|nr:3-dehydroquinate synthase [Nitratifractor salsuginis]ADV46541.1 3-dehydroquinate synthase [Nitratifractor salsuginis DSM 16511]